MENITTLLSIAVPQIPFLILDIIGISLAVTRRERHPKVSLLAGIYFAGRIILSFLGVGSSFLMLSMNYRGYSVSQLSWITAASSLMQILLGMILSVILLFVIFGWRAEKPSPPTID